ncbi:MAG TPA: recombinase family protein [Acidimicrobiia bacterium]
MKPTQATKSGHIRAAVYTRISKDQSNGLGVARQETLCRKLAEEKGWEVAAVYTDNDISAYNGAPRPAYARMLEDLQAGTVNAVICVDLDRLTRRPSEIEEFITLADQTGAHLANVSGDLDLSSSDGRFRARIMGAVARQESEKKSERIIRANDQRRARGAPHLGGVRPYGYLPARATDGTPTFRIVEDEATRIRNAIDDHLAGKSLNQIAREWNQAGTRTTKGGVFSATTVRRVLASPVCAGLLKLDRETMAGNWPAIIDRATHEAIRQKTEARKGQGQGGGRPPKKLLTGLVRCANCGAPLYWRVSIRREGAYVHVAKPETGPCVTPGLSINAESLEAQVAAGVLSRLDTPEVRSEMNRPLADPTAAFLEQSEAALSTLTHDRYVRGIVSERNYLEAAEALRVKIATLQMELAAPLPELPKGDPATLWDGATLEERHRIVGTMVSGITVSEGKSGDYDPERISITWR